MGREIRTAPPGWQHPKLKPEEVGPLCDPNGFKPLHDQSYEDAVCEYAADRQKWEAGTSDFCDITEEDEEFEDWFGEGPDPDHADQYRPAWTEAEATHLAVYETVSSGTPVTPFFATPEELVNYLVAHGDFWDQKRGRGGWKRENAEAFVREEWAPSMVGGPEGIKMPRDGA